VQLGAEVPNLEVAPLAPDPARVEMTAAGGAFGAGDLGKFEGTPARQLLSG